MEFIVLIAVLGLLAIGMVFIPASRREALAQWFASRSAGRAFGLVAFALVALIGLVAFGRGAGQGNSINLGALFLAVALMVAVVATLSINLAGIDPEADAFASSASQSPLGERLLLRWLHRVRWRRWIGGFIGLVAGLFATSVSNNTDLGSAAFVYPGLLGVTLGSLSAELHHLRPNRGSPRVADLTVRSTSDYTDPTDQKALAVCVAGALATFGYALSSDASTGWAVAALTIAAAGVALQHRVALRRRPALTAELREADDLLRTIAVSRGIARPAIALSLASIGVALAPSDTAAAETIEAVVWVAALVYWWRNRGLGLSSIAVPRQPRSSGAVTPVPSVNAQASANPTA